MLTPHSELPPTLNIRNLEIPESFRKAATGDLSSLEKGTEFILNGGAHALLYPDRNDDIALASTRYRAAVVTMDNHRYPQPKYVGVNEKGRSMAFFHLSGECVVTVDGQPFTLRTGVPIVTQDGQKVTIAGTGKIFILADGGETNEYPDQ